MTAEMDVQKIGSNASILSELDSKRSLIGNWKDNVLNDGLLWPQYERESGSPQIVEGNAGKE